MKKKITVGVGIGVFNGLEKLPNLEFEDCIVQFVKGIDDEICGVKPLLRNDLNIHNSAFGPKFIESKLYPEYIEIEWVGKFIQQQRIAMAAERIPALLSAIPTWGINSNWQSPIINSYDKVVIKPSTGAKGESVKVYKTDDPKVVRMMDIFNRDEEFHKEFEDCKHSKDSFMVQPLIPKLHEWRIINLGDNLIIADRDSTLDVSNTLGLDDPYHLDKHYKLPEVCNFDMNYFKKNVKRIIEEIGIPFGSSIDLILPKSSSGKFMIIEYQPQFGDRNMNPQIKEYIAKELIIHYIKPHLEKLKEKQ